MSLKLVSPQVLPPLDEGFRPAVLANQNFQREVESVGVRTVIGVERSGGEVSRFETKVYPEGHPNFESNFQYIERIVKFLLWQRGGHTLHMGGSPKIAEYLKKAYSRQGSQKFDNPLDELIIRLEVGMTFGQDFGFEAGDRVRAALQAENQPHASSISFTLKISIRQHGWAKTFIQWRDDAGRDQLQRHQFSSLNKSE